MVTDGTSLGLSKICRRFSPLVGAGMLFVIFLCGSMTSAQAPGGAPPTDSQPGSYYTNKSGFLIPFSQDPNDKNISAVLLHVSDDFGRTWRYLGYAQANQRSFQFRAPKDGWYWFAIQTQDRQQRYFPPNMNLAVPGLKVCVDTVPPQIYLKGTINTAGSASLDWEIRDEAFDPATMRLETRAAGSGAWVPLTVQNLATGSHVWNPGPGQVESRLSVRDKSGNLGEQILQLVPGQTKTAGVQGASLPASGGAGTGSGQPSNVLMVNHKRFQLNFKVDEVGPSDISRIEVWYTRNAGQTWSKYPQDAEKTPPCILEVPEEGRYGFTLIARSGVDLSEPPPRPGDSPHIWVEVDETKPQLKLLAAEVGRGVDQGTMTFVWTAADKFLGPNPITISYGTSAEGPWTPATKEPLANLGRYVWKMPETGLPFQFFCKLDCVDQAGNKASVITSTAVKVDLATPKARVVGVEAVGIGAAPAEGVGNGSGGNGTTGGGSSGNGVGGGGPSTASPGGSFGSPPSLPSTVPATSSPPEAKPAPPEAKPATPAPVTPPPASAPMPLPSSVPMGVPAVGTPSAPVPMSVPGPQPGVSNPLPSGAGTPPPPASTPPKPMPLPSAPPAPGGAPAKTTSLPGDIPSLPGLPPLP